MICTIEFWPGFDHYGPLCDASQRPKQAQYCIPSSPVASYIHTHTNTFMSQNRALTCTYCHKPGHTVDKCWRKPGNDRPANIVVGDKSVVAVRPPSTATVLSGGGEGADGAAPVSTVTGSVVKALRSISRLTSIMPHLCIMVSLNWVNPSTLWECRETLGLLFLCGKDQGMLRWNLMFLCGL